MKRFILWLDTLPDILRLIVSALATVTPFYFSALLSMWMERVAKASGGYALAIHAVVVIVLATGLVIIWNITSLTRAALRNEEERRRTALLHAYANVDRIVSARIADLRNECKDQISFIRSFCVSQDVLQGIVDAAYRTFEAEFGRGVTSTQRIDFEVTFMTKSYEDEHITIAAWANRDGRSPRSLILRKTNAEIYSSTVTAQVYREARPSMHIIGDTNNPDYVELYPDQKKRIRSTIVFPVLSDANEILGTLVVHCDSTGFFTSVNEKYWEDLMEVFAKRLALAKARLDKLIALARKQDSFLANVQGVAWF